MAVDQSAGARRYQPDGVNGLLDDLSTRGAAPRFTADEGKIVAALVDYAVREHPDQAELVEVHAHLIGSANEKPPENGRVARPSYVTVAVPPEWVKNLRGMKDKRGLVVMVYFRRELLEEAASPIVRPQPPGLVRP